jgi:sialate O-acetylesterase
MKIRRLMLAAWVVLGPLCARAEVKLPALFSAHMVLQAEANVAVWGRAAAGETVTVTIAGQSKTTQTGADGKWLVKLDKLKASSESQVLTVRGRNTITVQDVLVGEVWLASGQSNMEMQLNGRLHGKVDRADEESAAATYPAIRLFVHDAPFAIYEVPVPPAQALADRAGAWRVCSPQTVTNFSAIGYFFARDLHQRLGVPVGIISAAVGGTPIEAWTSLATQQAQPVLAPLLADWQKRLANFQPEREQQAFLEKKQAWLKQRAVAVKKGEAAPKAPAPFKNLGVMAPGALFNGVIAPLAPYALRGCLWYQGERNAAGPFTRLYGAQLQTLIADWRARWGDEFYFAWVQLPRFQKEQRLPSEPEGWGVAVRDGMRRTLAVPRTGMAITMDLGGEKAGHPTNKQDYAARLSLLALHEVYGQNITAWTGPLFRSVQREGNRMLVSFDHADGLKAASGALAGFALAGSDQKFVWASAKIEGGKVIAWSDTVREPVAIRYSWAANPKGNLVNGAGLPASPFCSDDGVGK